MNKVELLETIDLLITEAKIDEATAKKDIERMCSIGKKNGLLLARLFILDLEEK